MPEPSQAAHVRIGNGGGISLKPSDYRTVPLCHRHHSEQHQYGERTFWQKYGYDPQRMIARYLSQYVDPRRAVDLLEELAEQERSPDDVPDSEEHEVAGDLAELHYSPTDEV